MKNRAMVFVRKLRGRSARELAERGRQAASALLERHFGAEQGPLSFDALRARLDARSQTAIASPADWLDLARARPMVAPFAGLQNPAATAKAVCALDPEADRLLRERAELLMQGRFTLLGLEPVLIPEPVDWIRDPASGRRAPLAHWSAIDYLDATVAGDHKVVWELNRHHALVTLGQAYAASGDERFAARATVWMQQWLDANPPNRGINWASSLEVAYRAIAWIWTLGLLRRSTTLTPELFTHAAGLLYRSAHHLRRYPSTYFSPNTHLTGEALGLMYIGMGLPEFRESTNWVQIGWRILQQQLAHHVYSDGTYFEQSTWYHRYTFDIYAHALLLAREARLPDTERIADGVRRLAEALRFVSRPDGTVPLVGDDDGGRLLFLDGRTALDARPALSLGAALFARGDLRASSGGVCGELLWMLGHEGQERLARAVSVPEGPASRCFEEGGLVAVRDHWGPDGSLMLFDAGRHGAMNCGHAHADALSFDLTVCGTAVLVDPGTYTYTGEPEWRDHFRGSPAHNTVSLDSGSSSEPSGPFSWRRVSHPVLEQWRPGPAADYVRARLEWRADDSTHVVHRREVLAVSGAFWLVRDTLNARGGHEMSATFQCAVGISAEVAGEGVRMRQAERAVAVLTAFDRGSWVHEAGWVAPLYGRKVSADRVRRVLRFNDTGELVSLVLAPGYVALGLSSSAETGRRTISISGRGAEYIVAFTTAGSDPAAGELEGIQLVNVTGGRDTISAHTSRGAS